MTAPVASHYLICWLPRGAEPTPELFDADAALRPLSDRHLRLLAHVAWPDGKDLWARRVEDHAILDPRQVRGFAPA